MVYPALLKGGARLGIDAEDWLRKEEIHRFLSLFLGDDDDDTTSENDPWQGTDFRLVVPAI